MFPLLFGLVWRVFCFAFDAGRVRWELKTGGATECVSAGVTPASTQSRNATLCGRDGLQPHVALSGRRQAVWRASGWTLGKQNALQLLLSREGKKQNNHCCVKNDSPSRDKRVKHFCRRPRRNKRRRPRSTKLDDSFRETLCP